jgi:Mg2+-importing ATPase
MVPAVFLINGLSRHNWLEAFLFAMAVAVGLTPEMLPMIVTVNLSKGALAMSRKKVIVKRLNAIQNFGAMDVLCTDKTGTLTQGKIVLEKHLDVQGDPSEKVLQYGYLNSYHHTGLKNLLDEAILDHKELREHLKADEKYRKIDEIPFDFVRRRMSVVVEVKGEVIEVLPEHDAKRRQLAAHPHLRDHRRGRRVANGFAAGEHPRVCPAPAALLAVPGHHAAGLCDSDTGGEELVHSQVWRVMAAASRKQNSGEH